jgi:membrane protein implicated in regulation of membrane protease activity
MLLVVAILLAIFLLPAPWGIVAVAGAGAIEVGEALFFVRWSQRRRARMGVETLVGRRAIVMSALAPAGQVKIDGELWGARSDSPVESGCVVVVRDVDGLTLLVERQAR